MFNQSLHKYATKENSTTKLKGNFIYLVVNPAIGTATRRGKITLTRITHQARNYATIVSKKWCCLLINYCLIPINVTQVDNPNNSKLISKTDMLTIIAYSNCAYSLLRAPVDYNS